jgi:hypothetical protein
MVLILILHARHKITFIKKTAFHRQSRPQFSKRPVYKPVLRNNVVFVAQSYLLFEIHRYIKHDLYIRWKIN